MSASLPETIQTIITLFSNPYAQAKTLTSSEGRGGKCGGGKACDHCGHIELHAGGSLAAGGNSCGLDELTGGDEGLGALRE